MHQKVWIADGQMSYIGSANQDWKSLSQVQELGVACRGHVAHDVQNYFDTWWDFSGLEPAGYLRTYFSEEAGKEITTPCWQPGVPFWKKCLSPLPWRMATSKTHPGDLNGSSYYISASPGAVAGSQHRTFDLEALLDTINSATETVKLSVMEIMPLAPYAHGIWFPAINDAISAAVLRGVNVRFLSSHWLYTNPIQEKYLRELQETANTCRSLQYGPCSGSLEVRLFKIPGWQDQSVAYPDHTRVNHAKFAVSESWINVGTSNWDWGYFHSTAGTSFHSDNADLVSVGNAIFDRSWNSSFASPIDAATMLI